MSAEKFKKDSFRWLLQAEADLRAANSSHTMENFEWACFQSQQAGEKALKALWLYNHFDPWGHSLTKLIIDFPDKEMQKNELNPLLEHARHLDKLYIPTRYPNGLPDLSPFEVYDKNDSLNGIAAGKAILEAISLLMADS